jgi:L-lysine exporter family protein LysE/ArgO
MDIAVFMTGLATGLSLIVAIGAQNAFVLRQGLRGRHVTAVALVCSLSDAVLIALGVTSLGRISGWIPWITPAMRWGGVAFLAWYGAKSLWSALRSTEALSAAATEPNDFGRVMLTCLALTWLNPHVHLDTVVLLGTISTRFPGAEASFGLGATTASFLFFFALAHGARRLAPLFARPAAWRVLEAGVAVVMWTIALRLAVGD